MKKTTAVNVGSNFYFIKTFVLPVLSLMTVGCVVAQKEGQSFCGGDAKGKYFPLNIEKKKIYWADTYYYETYEKDTLINNITYKKFYQAWKNGNNGSLLLREEKGAVMEYLPKPGREIIRLDPSFEVGRTWRNEYANCTYTVIGYKEKLKTPFCRYEDLMAIKAEFPTVTFIFYYLKGYGYVGTTKDGALMSAVSPEQNN